MGKRGELTSAQIIMLVTAIAGFAIILIALFLINFGGYSEQDVCKLSVLTRATTPDIAQAAIPLKCKTKKICITDSYFGGCEDQFAGEDNIEYVRLSGGDDSKARQVEEVSANAMYDCWSMMGEGKLDLFAKGSEKIGFIPAEPTCVVCSRVAVDKGVSVAVLSKVNINQYMKTRQVPGSRYTYLQTFTDPGVSSYSGINKDLLNEKGQLDLTKYNEKTLPVDPNYAKEVASAATVSTDPREIAFVFSQVKPTSVGDVLSNLGTVGATLGAATFMSPVGKFASRVIFTPWGAAIAVAGAVAVGSYGAYNAYEGQLAAAGYCGNFSTSDDKLKAGCSLVQGLNYNFKEINAVCKTIQGEL